MLLLLVSATLATAYSGLQPLAPRNERLQRGAFPVIYVAPQELNLSLGQTVTVRLLIRNYGDEPVVNSILQVYGGDAVNITADGVKWSNNLTIELGAIPQGGVKPLTLFVRLTKSKNTTVLFTLYSDNADPSLASIVVHHVEPRETPASGNWPLILSAVLIIAAAAALLALQARKREGKTLSKRKKKR